jgi:hypothetical protein
MYHPPQDVPRFSWEQTEGRVSAAVMESGDRSAAVRSPPPCGDLLRFWKAESGGVNDGFSIEGWSQRAIEGGGSVTRGDYGGG